MNNVAKLLQSFEDIAKCPQKQFSKYISEGKKVVGCLPEYTPEELVVAAGMVPFGIWGAENKELSEAKKFFAPFYCSMAQTSLEMGLRGELNQLSAVLIPILCDTLKCLGQNWKIGVPQVPFIQVSHPQNVQIPEGTTYLAKVYQRIAKSLEEISGKKISDADLRAAIATYNEHRATMREFAKVAAQYPNLITPYKRSCVFKSSHFIEKAEHTAMVRSLIAELKTQPIEAWSGRKVVLTGIMADNAALLEVLEQNKIAVVADELAQESRQFMNDTPAGDDLYNALARQFTSMQGCSLIADPTKSRGPLLVEMAKQSGAQGVIYVQTKFCDPDEFDYPIVKRDLESAGIPVLNVEIDQQMQGFEQIRTAVQAYAGMLN